VVADLSGEKFRLGTFVGDPSVQVAAGAVIGLAHAETASPTSSDPTFPIPNRDFFKQVAAGDVITVGDGSALLYVREVSDDLIRAEVVSDGVMNNCRGLTVQGGDFRPRSLTDKDLRDLSHIIAHGDYHAVAVSFAASKKDIQRVRDIAELSGRRIPIIAKIETLAGVENISEIASASDYVMAARGDLALAIPWVDLPGAVDTIADTADATGTPWILATQIAEGLERFSIPTRAEICDLAHWVRRGCRGAMLSYETVFGAQAIAAVTCTAKVIARWA
jgi:pyruvate kinase